MAEKELTKEELEKMEQQREISLKNLKSKTLNDLAVAYYTNKDNLYGEAGNSAVEAHKYFPALQSKDGAELLTSYLTQSRQDGKRYTGNVSEYNLINNSAKIIQQSLFSIKFNDILELLGIEKRIKKDYDNKYLFELAESKDEEIQKMLSGVVNGYVQYMTDKGVSEALGERTKGIKKSLESILTEPEKKD